MIAVVLAAGGGRRLGGVAKALLEDGQGQSFLARIAGTAGQVGVSNLVVVVGPPYGDAVANHARALGAAVVVNPHPERGMGSSVGLGFAYATESDSQQAFLWPVDHPWVRASTLERLSAALGNADAVVPTLGLRGGHPVLVGRSLFGELAEAGARPEGARTVLRRTDHRVLRIEVGDQGVIHDVDTAEDLRVLRERGAVS